MLSWNDTGRAHHISTRAGLQRLLASQVTLLVHVHII